MSGGWLGLPPAEAIVECGGEPHRLRWQAGELLALDHDDPEGDRTLAVLGGESCPCLELLEAWHRHADDVRALVLGPRGAGDRLAGGEGANGLAGGAPPARTPRPVGRTAPSRPSQGSSASVLFAVAGTQAIHGAARPGARSTQSVSTVAGLSRSEREESDLAALLGLGGGVPERLVATVAATWRERMIARDRRAAAVRAQLHAALYGRVRMAMREWLGASGSRLELGMIAEGATPGIEREEGIVRVELPFGWLVEVWARGMAVVFGRLCLAAASSDGVRWELTTVDAGLSDPQVIRLELPS